MKASDDAEDYICVRAEFRDENSIGPKPMQMLSESGSRAGTRLGISKHFSACRSGTYADKELGKEHSSSSIRIQNRNHAQEANSI